jgi:hypothetical protein
MRNLAFIVFTLFILACGQKKTRTTVGWNYDNAEEIAYYPVEIPIKKLKNEEPRKIIFDRGKKTHYVTFGKYNIETTWEIYDWLSYRGSDSQLPKPLIKESFKSNEEVLIDITFLDTGQYMIGFNELYEYRNFELNIE